MISIVIGVIVGILFFVSMKKSGENVGFIETALMGFAGFIVTEVIGMAVFAGTATSTEVKLVSSQPIIALADVSSESGSYFLGSGSSNSNDYYVFYVKDEYGYKREKLRAHSASEPTYINYISKNETPRVDTYSEGFYLNKKPSIFFTIIPCLAYINKNPGDSVGEPYVPNGRVELYIPEGSIKENYLIDME